MFNAHFYLLISAYLIFARPAALYPVAKSLNPVCDVRIHRGNQFLRNEIRVIVIFTGAYGGRIILNAHVATLLVKLCLHRASDLLAVFLLVGVFPALWHKVVDGHFVEKLLVSQLYCLSA